MMCYKNLIKLLIKNILPDNRCLICQIDSAKLLGICKFCYSILPWIKISYYRCHKCLTILPNKSKLLCQACNNDQQIIFKFFAIFEYQPPIKNLLLALKFKHNLVYAKFFSKILLEYVQYTWYIHQPMPEAIIPVPLHLDRLRCRGFNQAVELAKSLKSIIKIDTNSCWREKNTNSQTTLYKQQRKANTIHAFKAAGMPYKHIAIIDDIITTGSTIYSLAKAIKQVNQEIRIDAWTIARA